MRLSSHGSYPGPYSAQLKPIRRANVIPLDIERRKRKSAEAPFFTEFLIVTGFLIGFMLVLIAITPS